MSVDKDKSFTKRFKDHCNEYFLEHPKLKTVYHWATMIVVTVISSFVFSYGYRAFTAPAGDVPHLISGGASGIGQILTRISQLCGVTLEEKTLQSIFYLAINIPLILVSFKNIGKEFTITTLLNVVLTSVFIDVIPDSWVVIFDIDQEFVARALFAGIMTGLSSGSAYLIGSSTGGIDLIALAIAEKKSTTSGKYSLFINAAIIITYTIVNSIKLGNLSEVKMALFTLIYFFTASKVIDVLNIKNRKTELQINTDSEDMAKMLLRTFPHGCTLVDAVGGYTGKPRKIIYMVVSLAEVKSVVEFARKIDKNCFVNVTNSNQVYGRFYIKPIK